MTNMQDLSVNELLWLSAETVGKCPYCGENIVINAKNICLRMGMTIKNADGTKTVKKQSFIVDCEHCGKTIDVELNATLKKED